MPDGGDGQRGSGRAEVALAHGRAAAEVAPAHGRVAAAASNPSSVSVSRRNG
jgi:hypothetical protein